MCGLLLECSQSTGQGSHTPLKKTDSLSLPAAINWQQFLRWGKTLSPSPLSVMAPCLASTSAGLCMLALLPQAHTDSYLISFLKIPPPCSHPLTLAHELFLPP